MTRLVKDAEAALFKMKPVNGKMITLDNHIHSWLR